MGISSIGQSGSVSGNATGGLINKMARGLGLQGNPQPQPGLLQSHTPNAPVKKMKDSQGNEVHFDTANAGKVKGVLGTKTAEASTSVPKYGDVNYEGNGVQSNFGQNAAGTQDLAGPAKTGNTGGGSNNTGTNPNPPAQTPPVVTPPVPLPATPITPQVGTTKENYQNVYNAGQFTPEERQAKEDLGASLSLQKGYQNTKTFGGLAAQPGFDPNNPNQKPLTPAEIQQQLARPDLESRKGAIAGLYGGLGDLYGSATVAGAQGRLGAAQTQASRAAGAAGTVAAASNLSPTAQGQAPFSALGGYEGGSGQYGNPTALSTGVNVQSYKDMQSQYNAGKQTLAKADTIQKQITDTIKANPTLNLDPVTLVNTANQYLGANFSGTPQQQLALQVQQYIKTLSGLGIDSATITNIAHQSQGSMATLLDSLRSLAEANNVNPDTLNLFGNGGGGNGNSSGGATGDNSAKGAF